MHINELIILTVVHDVMPFFFQLSPDIQTFVHSVISKDGVMNDEEV